MNKHKKEVNMLKMEKDSLQDTLKKKTIEVKSTLLQELNKVEDEKNTAGYLRERSEFEKYFMMNSNMFQVANKKF